MRSGFVCGGLLAAVLVCGVGCDSSTTPVEEPLVEDRRSAVAAADASVAETVAPVRPPRDWNVVVITIDTLRADALGAYGQPRETSPNIDRMAAEGVVFEHVAAPAPTTLPSHSTLFTGKHPFAHGVRSNFGYVLPEENVTLAEALTKTGHATGAEIGAAVLDRKTKIAQGFAHVRDTKSPDAQLLELTRDVDGRKVTRDMRIGSDVARRGVEFIRKHRDDPFFLWLHFFDVHAPYTAPGPFLSRFEGERYLAGVAFADAQVGRVLDEVRRLGIQDHTWVVLTSDHGESLGEHGELTHASLVYEGTIRVPLIIWGPEALPAGRRIEALVRTVDIAPTLLDLLGHSPLPGAQGASLAGLILGRESDPGLLAYGESFELNRVFGLPPLRYVREGNWKYIHKVNPELYDLSADPEETRNLAQQRPQIRDRLRSRLEEMLAESSSGASGSAVAVDSERRAELEALGYVAGEAGVRAGFDELESLALAGEDPNNKIMDVEMWATAAAAKASQDFGEAARIYRALLQRNPESLEIMGNLATMLVSLEREEEAIALHRRALELDPGNVDHLRALSSIMQKREDKAEALRVWMALLEVEPCSPVRGLITATLHAQERYREQVEVMRTNIEGCEGLPAMLNNLAWALATTTDDEVRNGTEALEAIERAMKLLGPTKGQSPAYLDTRAAALAELGRFEEAARVQERTVRNLRNRQLPPDAMAPFEQRLELYRQGRPMREP